MVKPPCSVELTVGVGESCEVDGDGPALGAFEQRRHVVAVNRTCQLLQQGGGLGRVERQVLRADFDDPSSGPQPAHGQRDRGAAGQRQSRPRRHLGDEGGQRVQGVAATQHVDVVEHEGERAAAVSEHGAEGVLRRSPDRR